MTLLKLAMTETFLLRGLRLRRFGEQHAEDFLVQTELRAQLRDDRRRPGENDVRVKAGGVLVVRDAGKRLLVHLLHGFDFAAGRGDVRRNLVERVFDALFLACCVQYEQTFVSFHCFFFSFVESTTPLNWFIAFSIPPSSQHSIWSDARSKTFSNTTPSAGSNRPRTKFVISRAPSFRPIPTRNRANSREPRCCSMDSSP